MYQLWYHQGPSLSFLTRTAWVWCTALAASLAEYLPSKLKALGSTPSTTKKEPLLGQT